MVYHRAGHITERDSFSWHYHSNHYHFTTLIVIYSVESELYTSDMSSSIRQVRTLCLVLPHLPHRRLPPAPFPTAYPFLRISCSNLSSISFSANKSSASPAISDPPRRMRVFLALRRLLSASLALRRDRFSAVKKVTE